MIPPMPTIGAAVLGISMLAPAQTAVPTLAPPASAAAPPGSTADIVVRGRRGRRSATIDAVAYYRRYCFDAARLGGRSASPADDPDWQPLDAANRAKFGIGDPSVPAFGLADPVRGQTLLLKTERFDRPGGLVEDRCTMVVIGGDQTPLQSRLSNVFGGPPTQRHVGAAVGTPRIPGWRQWLWSAMPARGSRNWRSINGAGKATRDTFVVVTSPTFYDDYDYVLGDLKTREDAKTPLSVVSFVYITRPRIR